VTGSRSCGFKKATAACFVILAASAVADPPIPEHIRDAVAHPDRSDADRARDLNSRPGEVLAFLDLEPGMTVFDMLGGDGYYSEMLARAVGPTGRVYLHNNQGYAGLMRGLPRRLAGEGLDALEVYVREIGDINLPSESVDLVVLVKVYHDLYYLNNGWNVPPGPFFETIHRILKTGGTLAVIDHAAPAGTGARYAQNLHRIDPAFARKDIESRGFEFVAGSDLLINPADDLARSPFAPDLRGRTSRFLHRYRKP
jgi:predicted methyltransferase